MFISKRNEFWYAFSSIYIFEAVKLLCINFFLVWKDTKKSPYKSTFEWYFSNQEIFISSEETSS